MKEEAEKTIQERVMERVCKCEGCDTDLFVCMEYWKEKKVCCPECNHSVKFILRQAISLTSQLKDEELKGIVALAEKRNWDLSDGLKEEIRKSEREKIVKLIDKIMFDIDKRLTDKVLKKKFNWKKFDKYYKTKSRYTKKWKLSKRDILLVCVINQIESYFKRLKSELEKLKVKSK